MFPQIRDFEMEDHNENNNNNNNNGNVHALSSRPFSIMCACLTVLYAGFAVVVFYYSPMVLAELKNDENKESKNLQRFDIRRNTFVAPTPVVVNAAEMGALT